MGRPRKTGLDYFPHDTDAANDEKIEMLRALYGAEGYAFYFILLERIYRTEKGELNVNSEEWRILLASKIGISAERFNMILASAVSVGLFDKKAFNSKGLLTSKGIKKRVKDVDAMRERWRNKPAKIIPKENPKDNPKDTPTDISGENSEETPESKAKQSKANNKEIYIAQALFESVWKEYPNKRGKAHVSEKKKRELLDVGYEALHKCIERYRQSKPDWQEWQHGSTFFNSGYVDYLDENFDTGADTSADTGAEQPEGWGTY